MKRIFASSIWTRVILVLAVIFIVWSIVLIVSVQSRQDDLADEVELISKLNGVAQSIMTLEKSLSISGPDSLARWRSLYNDYRARRSEFGPSEPKFRELQVNLIRTDSLLIRIDRLHTDFRQAVADPLLQKSVEADFHREINAATVEVQNAVQTIRERTGKISATMAENWNALFVLVLVACGLAIAVTLLQGLLQKEMAKIKEADESLRQSAERLRQTFEHAPIGMATSTAEGKFIQVNPAFCKLLGYSEAELLRRNLAEIFHPEDLAAHREFMSRLLRGEISHFQLEKRYLTAKRQIVYALLQASLVRDGEGATPLVIEQVVDMTERKKAEFARRQSEERFRELAENIAEVFWLTDPAKNEMLYVSPAYEKIWDRSCQSLYETPHTWFDAVHLDDRERVKKAALTKQVIGQYDETYRILRPDGEARWIRDRAFPIRDEQGSVYRLAGIAEDITECKNTEAAIRENAQRWNFALEGSGAGVWDWDAQTNKVFYSRRWKEMLGYQEHEIGDSLDECYSRVHPEDLKTMVGALEKHLRGETPLYISEHRERCKDGGYKWILDRGKVVARTAEGKPLRVVGTHTDITEPTQAKVELKQSEDSLRKNEEQFCLTFEHAPIGMSISSIDGAILQVNQAYCDLLGRTAEELVNRSVMEFTYPDDTAENLDLTRKLLRGEIPHYQMEKRYLAKDGHAIYAILQASLVRDRDGHPLHFLGQIADITKRKLAEEEVRKLNAELEQRVIARTKELQQSEERYRTLIETMNDGLVQLDEKGLLVYVNDKMCEMTGFSREQLLGREVLPRLDAESQEILRQQIERRQTGESKPYEMEIRKKDGGQLPALISPQPIFGFDGGFSGSFAVVTDISERKRMEEQIRRHAEELEQLVEERAKRIHLLEQQRAESEKLAATGRMSARIAHEINNPLAGIKNSFLLVKDGIPTTHRYYDYVRRIETEIERIARIVRQMFDLYRPEQDSMRSFPTDLAIRDVVALLKTNCRERDITIDVEINAPALNVALSESSLRQVLYNVIQNAIDASAPGGTVRVRAVSESQKLTINVIDQGQGVPEDIRTKIFEPFFTTKSGLERSGLGLGLAVSKGLVEAMGGKLDFESTVGQGTTFAIVLPLHGASGKTTQH